MRSRLGHRLVDVAWIVGTVSVILCAIFASAAPPLTRPLALQATANTTTTVADAPPTIAPILATATVTVTTASGATTTTTVSQSSVSKLWVDKRIFEEIKSVRLEVAQFVFVVFGSVLTILSLFGGKAVMGYFQTLINARTAALEGTIRTSSNQSAADAHAALSLHAVAAQLEFEIRSKGAEINMQTKNAYSYYLVALEIVRADPIMKQSYTLDASRKVGENPHARAHLFAARKMTEHALEKSEELPEEYPKPGEGTLKREGIVLTLKQSLAFYMAVLAQPEDRESALTLSREAYAKSDTHPAARHDWVDTYLFVRARYCDSQSTADQSERRSAHEAYREWRGRISATDLADNEIRETVDVYEKLFTT